MSNPSDEPRDEFPPDPDEVSDTGAWIEFTKQVDGETVEGRIRVRREGTDFRYDYEIGNIEDTTARLWDRGHDGRFVGWRLVKEITESLEAAGVILPEEADARVERQEAEFEAEITAQKNEYDRAMRATPLRFSVEEMTHTGATAGWGKTERTAWVLMPTVGNRAVDFENERERFLTDEEECALYALTDLLGETAHVPNAEGEDNPFTADDRGEEFTVDEVAARVDGFDDAVRAVERRREKTAAWEELVDEFPVLAGVDTDAETARDALDEAAADGEPVSITTTSARCSDPSEECSLDRVTYRATPDGEIETDRSHTW